MTAPDSLLNWFDQFSTFASSPNFQMAGFLLIFYVAILWIAVIIWVTRDAIHRTSHPLFQIVAVLLNIFLPIFGLILYLIVRPEKTLLEKYHEDLEYRMLEGGDDLCFSCTTQVKEAFLYCPNCAEALHHECVTCQKTFSRRWSICPYCGENQKTEKKEEKKKKKK